MNDADLPVAGGPAAVARAAGERAVRALTTGISDAIRRQRAIARETRSAPGLLRETDGSGAISIDRAGRALIHNDRVHGGRREESFDAWLREVRDRGADPDRTVSDLGRLWDYLRHDPKWAIDPQRNYGGIVFFGSRDIGGSAVVTNTVRDHGLYDVPVVFSGNAGEAAKFRAAAERAGLNSGQILEEPFARNTGQNATFAVQMLKDHGRDITSIIGACTPFHARRVWGTLMKQCPDTEHAAITAADVSLENYMKYGNRPDAETAPPPKSIVAVTLGEMKRLDEYPAEGHIVREEVPDDVRSSYERLSETFRPAERRY